MYDRLGSAWESAKLLFRHKKIDEVFSKELPNSDFRLGVVIFALAALITAVLSILSTGATAYFGIYAWNTMAEVTDVGTAEFDIYELVPFAGFQFLFIVPFSIVYSLVYERIMYQVLRLLKGKATFAQHYYLSSITALSLSMAALITLLFPLPCIQLLAFIGFLLLSIYFSIHVSSKAYEKAHGLPYIVVLSTVLVFAIPRIILVMFIINGAGMLFGIPSSFDASGV